MSYYYGWKPYVPVAKRRAQAKKKLDQLRKKGENIQPVEIAGRKITTTFWGNAWCDHMESQGDFANRLPRGRTYVRNGSVCHLAIEKGRIQAKVSGSELYNIDIKIDLLPKAKWKQVQQRCSGQIGTLLELLQGRISDSVMEVVTDPKQGLFPSPAEIHLRCDCPDYASMCKHLAAVLYGVGARLDNQPELLFTLRGVDHTDLVTGMSDDAVNLVTHRGSRRQRVAETDLADVFGIELDEGDAAALPSSQATGPKSRKKTLKKAKSPQADSQTSQVKKKTAKQATARAKKLKGSEAAKPSIESKTPARKKKAAQASVPKTASVENSAAKNKVAKRPKQAAKKKRPTPK